MVSGTAVEHQRPDDEEGGSDGSLGQLFRLLVQMSWPLRGRAGLLLLLTSARAACLALVVYLLDLTLRRLSKTSDPENLWPVLLPALGLFGCQIGAAVCQYLGDEAQRWFLAGVELGTFRWALERLLLLPADYFRTRSLVKFVLHLDKLQLAIRTFFNLIITSLTRLAMVVSVVGVLLAHATVFALGGIAALTGLSFLSWLRTRWLREQAKEELRSDVKFLDQVLAIFTNLHDLHRLGLRQEALDRLDKACDLWTARSVRLSRIQTSAAALVHVAGILLLAALLGLAYAAGQGSTTLWTTFAALAMLLEPLGELVRIRTAMQIKVTKLGDILQFNENRLQERRQLSGTTKLDGPIVSLRLNSVSYELKGVPLLRDITLEASRGEIVGIIGRSGAGKTTLANILLRLLDPTSGQICVNGIDARDLCLTSFWSQTSGIFQVPVRLEASIAEELALVHPQATEEEILRALVEAGIPPELRWHSLPAGDTQEPAGQDAWHTRSLQQRLEWARIWLRPASLVVLDEPTSLCDSHFEQRFLQGLLQRRGQWITFLISHRPATLAVCDRLIVLDAGRIVAQGPRGAILTHWLSALDEKGAQAG
jgi:ABC-type multidrug transport system fused ATPase/permease subunit